MKAFAHAAAIEESLELLAERGDPTAAVYARLFEQQPDMLALFWRDSDGAIKGEMLSRVFGAILDFIGERRYAAHMIGAEIITHEGYDVPRAVFATFFGVVAETVAAELGPDWTPAMAEAWGELLAELDAYVQATPLVGAAA
jgi:hemoglobin-like flavoprotein